MNSLFSLNTLVLFAAVIIAVPSCVVFGAWLWPDWGLWSHLSETVLGDYIVNSLVLAFGVGITCGFLGTWCAWCVSQYQFAFSRYFKWLLFLPLAFPPYIMGYTYTGLLDFSGPFQELLREATGWGYGDYWFPDIQSMSGAIFTISVVLFPYVYGLAYVAFSSQSQSLFDVSRSQGLNERQYFYKVALPLALPAISAGMLLAMMEAFADFGTVEYLGVSTLATGIFRTWFGMNEPLVAAQLSSGLVCFVLFLLWGEKWVRRKQRFYHTRNTTPNQPRRISWQRQSIVLASLLSIFLLAFVIPVIRLVSWSVLVVQTSPDFAALFTLLKNSFLVAAIAAIVVMTIALLFGYAQRAAPPKVIKNAIGLATMGYAFPGAVIAVGAVIALGNTDQWLNKLTLQLFDFQPGLVLSGTLFALIFAYVIRYLTVGYQHVLSGLARVSPSLDEAGKTLAESGWGILRRIHAPILKPTLLVGILMVFVDVLKELPATLILRPFNFDTLAVKTYELASDERLTDASLPALFIVLAGLLPVWFIQKNINTN
ncbi:ABC transporter permease [Planctobacterium marinum]|uniref:ABC transporter permease n=1 Tax=Planctobacterium marinum TaxID=1631968 RepID=UPI001E48789F|nr:iron ABC transporter permease [Planctobacterium marinum]MCC2604480.1 iron ABC transporter permease [Planctobacterium marinum]